MSAGHTPGPWVNGGKGCLTVATKASGGNLGETIAICTDEEISRGDAQANARLIAAAPEILEALRMIVSERSDFGEIAPESWASARNVIAKAGAA